MLRSNESQNIDEKNLIVCAKGAVRADDSVLREGDLMRFQGRVYALEELNYVIVISKVEEFTKKKS